MTVPTTKMLLEAVDSVDADRLRRCRALGRVDDTGLRALVERFIRLDQLGAALASGALQVSELERLEPELMAALADDLGRPAVLDRWGLSTTVDDVDCREVQLVPDPLVQHFAKSLGREPDPRRCHAGLAHTYGYLFSPLPTTYGRKRHRWSTQEVAHALGIPGPWPLAGRHGVLAALTSVLEQVAPLDREPLGLHADVEVAARIDGELTMSGTEDGTRWHSRTRILAREGLTAVPEGDELLLVHSLAVDDGLERYVTAFPVSASYAEVVLRDTRPRLRFLARAG